ncbi:MAG: hypothetical protein IPN71_20725 [Fibrobacteres bacterium]|nr:hypothetical protein [Fibrobacterota bacterium]
MALPTDGLLDSLQLAAFQQEEAGQFAERDQTESLLENLSRQRIVADSSPELPRARLNALEQLRMARARRDAEELSSRRAPPAVDSIDSPQPEPIATTPATPALADSAVAVEVRPVDSAGLQRPPPSVATRCTTGVARFRWISPAPAALASRNQEAVDVKARIDAPCGLSRVDLFLDDQFFHSVAPGTFSGGAFEFMDRVPATPGVHRLEILACDTFDLCARSAPAEFRIAGPIPSWIPRAVGTLVVLCGLLGLGLALRRRPHSKAILRPSGSSIALPIPDSTGISGTLRRRLQQVAQEIGPGFPAVSLRIPDNPPALNIDPESIGDALTSLLRFHAKRSVSGGQVLIAMGHGPLSAEVVFEDTASTPDDGILGALFDTARPFLKDRLGLDQELIAAKEAFNRPGCSLFAEARIDGGLRCRMKIPLLQGPT